MILPFFYLSVWGLLLILESFQCTDLSFVFFFFFNWECFSFLILGVFCILTFLFYNWLCWLGAVICVCVWYITDWFWFKRYTNTQRFDSLFVLSVVPDVRIPEREERRPPRQSNSQKGKFITDSSQGSCRIQRSGAGSESPEPKLLPKFIGWT